MILSRHFQVFRGRVFHHKLTEVATCVADLQLRDGHIQNVAARVSADTDAVFVLIFFRSELALGKHEQHFNGMLAAAQQIHTERCGVIRLDDTGENHRVALVPLQVANDTVCLKKGKEKAWES